MVTAADYPFLDIVGTMLVFFAWVIWIDNGSLREGVRQAWLPRSVLRPARSDINIWNDGPWR